MFVAVKRIAFQVCEDKLLQIYFLGLKLLKRGLEPDICMPKITAKMVQREVYPFIDLLIQKIEELDFRAKENSLVTLIDVFKHKDVDVKVIYEKLLQVEHKG